MKRLKGNEMAKWLSIFITKSTLPDCDESECGVKYEQNATYNKGKTGKANTEMNSMNEYIANVWIRTRRMKWKRKKQREYDIQWRRDW